MSILAKIALSSVLAGTVLLLFGIIWGIFDDFYPEDGWEYCVWIGIVLIAVPAIGFFGKFLINVFAAIWAA